jgi:hypothetical protein
VDVVLDWIVAIALSGLRRCSFRLDCSYCVKWIT